MFTGIIEGLGTVAEVRGVGSGRRLRIRADFALEGSAVGDSISVSGACLTAVRIDGAHFEADLSPETLATTALGRLRVGERVNLERALRLSDRLDGHIVSGHVDGVGTLRRKEQAGNATVVSIGVPSSLGSQLVLKGSVAVDGISLTVNRLESSGGGFAVSIIPHTARMTTIGLKGAGDPLNIETDMLGKYVERLLTRRGGAAGAAPGGGLDRELLARMGWL
jgi:riboflavin synthase